VDRDRTSEACRVGDLVSTFVQTLTPRPGRYDSVVAAVENLLPPHLQAHCRIGGFHNGSLKLLTDASSYLFELQLCRAVLLRELQHLCPGARVRRIEVGMFR
jgi:hypothetical protein